MMRTWYSTKPCLETEKSQISHAVVDSTWEHHTAQVLKKRSDVASDAKNDHLTGCANDGSVRKAPTYEQAAKNPFVPATYKAADMLLAQLQGRLSIEQPLIVATTVNIDALEKSSTLGRLVSEQVSARFTQHKFRMIEMKFRNNVYMLQGQGELMLTREIRDIATSHSAQAVVVGTYAESSNFVFLNLKVVDPNTNIALAVHDFAMPLDEDVRKMLRSR